MIAPDHRRTDAEQARENFRGDRPWRRRLGRGIFAATAIVIAYLTLMPNHGHAHFRIVPMPLYRWLVGPEQDWLVNIIAFGFFAVVVFTVGRKSRWRGAGLAALFALVCAIETVQIWIPGRTSSLDDVCAGWSGIFAAWLFAVLWDACAENGGGK